MRFGFVLAAAVALTGCGQADEESTSRERLSTHDVEDVAPAAPGIAVTAAPGVAFNYLYEFRLPPAIVARTQESHAQGCEKLGIARCRITGMRYRLLGENKVEAMLAFKLDPAIARAFGKNAIDLVETAKGKLIDAEITGTDAGAAISRLNTQRAQLADEQRRLDAELARTGRSAGERTALQNQRAEVTRQIDATANSTTEQRDSLATTPMTFNYGSGPAVRGFDASAPLTSAVDTAAGSAQVTLAVLLGAAAVLGPPALVLVLAWLLWRRFGRRWRTSQPVAS